ncbi:hypothetical protein H8K52_10375 [Undibacterium seohonense]|jgi:hypothetical protein|uniref:Uncharacterized protein n=1 Tax=Undibacterium seohonense TaxID=1344950 RepID=A0ABR6X4H4_9BURK|nr:hypothetical protein [Undibacterium seohonense]MBC3807750.1 hypothetical protein [Undibacterium seohonense]
MKKNKNKDIHFKKQQQAYPKSRLAIIVTQQIRHDNTSYANNAWCKTSIIYFIGLLVGYFVHSVVRSRWHERGGLT